MRQTKKERKGKRMKIKVVLLVGLSGQIVAIVKNNYGKETTTSLGGEFGVSDAREFKEELEKVLKKYLGENIG